MRQLTEFYCIHDMNIDKIQVHNRKVSLNDDVDRPTMFRETRDITENKMIQTENRNFLVHLNLLI